MEEGHPCSVWHGAALDCIGQNRAARGCISCPLLSMDCLSCSLLYMDCLSCSLLSIIEDMLKYSRTASRTPPTENNWKTKRNVTHCRKTVENKGEAVHPTPSQKTENQGNNGPPFKKILQNQRSHTPALKKHWKKETTPHTHHYESTEKRKANMPHHIKPFDNKKRNHAPPSGNYRDTMGKQLTVTIAKT